VRESAFAGALGFGPPAGPFRRRAGVSGEPCVPRRALPALA